MYEHSESASRLTLGHMPEIAGEAASLRRSCVWLKGEPARTLEYSKNPRIRT